MVIYDCMFEYVKLATVPWNGMGEGGDWQS